VKQNLKLTNLPGSPIALALLALTLVTANCATQSRQSSTVVQFNTEAAKAERSSLININTATAPELEKLPGIGKVTAERIVAQREQYGPFRRVEHLMMVRGVSDRKFRALRSMIVVE
jgi:competence protein ComEA